MLLNLREYHRPAAAGGGLEQVIALLARPGIRTVPLAGGDALLASADPTVEAVVDLQGLGLDTIAEEGHGQGRLRIGALAARQRLADYTSPAATSHPIRALLAEAAQRWGGSVQRNRATVGGALVAAAANDPLVAALLVCDALVELYGPRGAAVIPIAEFHRRRAALLAEPAVVTHLIIPCPSHPIGARLACVARTPADAAIVLAVALLELDGGRCLRARLALGGVADAALRLEEVESMLAGQIMTPELIAAAAARVTELVRPAGDFRGSAEYRKAMAAVLAERALREAWDVTR
jgi:carbon-monoxide dehydrogenase medium subunit